jgi:hypothetical protein
MCAGVEERERERECVCVCERERERERFGKSLRKPAIKVSREH